MRTCGDGGGLACAGTRPVCRIVRVARIGRGSVCGAAVGLAAKATGRKVVASLGLVLACVISAAASRAAPLQRPATDGTLRVLPSNPRYFTDGSGRAIYLTGSHVWWNLA